MSIPLSPLTASHAGARSAFARRRNSGLSLTLLCAALSLGLFGCKGRFPGMGSDDAATTTKVQAALGADSALAGQPLQAAVQGGVVTLTGSVANDAQSTLAARDAAGVAGVKQVQNNLSVTAPEAATASVTTPPPAMPVPAPAPLPVLPLAPKVKPSPEPKHTAAPIERPQQAYNPSGSNGLSGGNQAPPPAYVAPVAPPPPPPSFKTLTLAAGNTIPVRVTQTLDSETTMQGAGFSGVVASDIIIDGVVAIPAGSPVAGHVDAVQDAAHFKGASALTVSLSSVTRRGERIPVTTDPYTVQGKGRGANTVEKTAGGAAVGAVLGGIFGGGKGAAIGAAAGGGVGAGSNAVTRGQQVTIASESVVRFHLTTPVLVKVRTDGGPESSTGGGLQQHPNQ